MRRLVVIGLLLCATVVFAQTAEKKDAPAAAPAKAKMVGEITVRTIPAMTAATVMEKAVDFAPKEGYKTGMEGAVEAWTKMLPDAYTKLDAWMKGGGVPTGPSFVIYYEDPTKTPAKDLTYKVAFPTAKGAKGTDAVKIEDMPEHQAAVLQFSGPYEGNFYGDLMMWIPEHGYQFAGPPSEVYIKSARDNVKPTDYLTEIHFPVMKAETPKPADKPKVGEAPAAPEAPKTAAVPATPEAPKPAAAPAAATPAAEAPKDKK